MAVSGSLVTTFDCLALQQAWPATERERNENVQQEPAYVKQTVWAQVSGSATSRDASCQGCTAALLS